MKVDQAALEMLKEAEWYNRWILSFIKSYLQGSILDIGAGIGNFTSLLKNYGEVTAIDQNKKYVKLLRNHLTAGFGDIEKGTYFFGDKKFDTIISFNVLEHIANDTKAISNIKKLLVTNGHFVVLVPAHHALYSSFDKAIGHFRRYTTTELTAKLVKFGLEVVAVRYFNWWAAIGWLVFMKYLKSSHLPGGPVSLFNYLGRIFLWPEKIFAPPFGLSVLAIARKL